MTTDHNLRPTLARFFRAYGWIVIGAICAFIAYMVIWQHGLYQDDYTYLIERSLHFWIFPARFGQQFVMDVVFDSLFPSGEWWIRLLFALGIVANAFLAGQLVKRALNSTVAQIATFWLCLIPVIAHEAVMWPSAESEIIPGALFSLIFLYVYYTGLCQPSKARSRLVWCAIALFASLAFSETMLAGTLVAVVMLAAIYAFQSNRLAFRYILRFTTSTLLIAFIVSGLVYVSFYKNNPVYAQRIGNPNGTPTLSLPILVDHAQTYLSRFQWMIFSRDWGQKILSESITVGVREAQGNPWTVLAFVLIIGLILIQAFLTSPKTDSGHSGNVGLLVAIVGGILWFVSSMLIPGIFAANQILEYRMLYFAYIGLVISFCAALALISRRFLPAITSKAAIMVAGGLLVGGTLCILGYAKAYAARSALDQRQINATVEGLKLANLPVDVTLVPYNFDEHTMSDADSLNKLLVGAFETPWGAHYSLIVQAGINETFVTATRWAPMRLAYIVAPDTPNEIISVQGQQLQADKMLLYTFRDNQIFVYTSIKFILDPTTTHTVDLPIGDDLARSGVATLGELTISASG